MKTPYFFAIIIMLVSVTLTAQTVESAYPGLDIYIGGEIGGVSDGWNADMVIGATAGFYLSPRKRLNISDIPVASFIMECQNFGIDFLPKLDHTDRLHTVTKAVFDKSGGVGFGIQTGYQTAGIFVSGIDPDSSFNNEDSVFQTLNYVPVLLSFQHIIGLSKYQIRHVTIQEYNLDTGKKTDLVWTGISTDFYFGYRISAGPAFVMKGFDPGSSLPFPINARLELLVGGLDKHFSYINASIFYNALIFGESTNMDKGYMGTLGINWTLSFSTKKKI